VVLEVHSSCTGETLEEDMDVQTVMKSRAGMGFLIMVVFFALFYVSPDLVIAFMWVGAQMELCAGLYAGVRNAKSILYTIFLMVYITIATYCLWRCLDLDFWGSYVVIQFVGTSDTAQYYVGKNFGSIRIFPASPKKSLEGYMGGLVVAFVALKVTCPAMETSTALILTIAGMFGDFFASVWKRLVGIKDASTIFGSHGGMLDRFDSHSAVFIVIGYIYNLEKVVPYDPATILYPLYGWVLFCSVFHTVDMVRKQGK